MDAPGAGEFPDEAAIDPNTRLIIELENAVASFGADEYPFDVTDRFSIVVRGVIEGDGSWTNSGVGFWVSDALEADLKVDSHADIHTTGGARGINVSTDDEDPAGSIRVRNFGSVLAESDGPNDNQRRDGVNIYSRGGDVEASNEAGATIETRGAGGRGLQGGTNGYDTTVVVVNRGSVTTTGERRDDGRSSYGVVAFGDGINSTARAVNESGATILTEGEGARGLYASACAYDDTLARLRQLSVNFVDFHFFPRPK